ncbi:hypothetical protein MNBD_NITROSPINAE04-2673 [hydrothermal vent metagenome]|uniref:Urease accessory protein UreH-like transmembrane domain-containing protein n=1 Tax=hydrothermal vent metagenome TaxID=652676 RepID=A0A3B1CGT9_9ZZZZ
MTTSTEAGFAFVIGLAGGLHCIGMCGGIITALSIARQGAGISGRSQFPRLALYHAGRISGYMLIGLVLGSIGATAASLASTLWIQKGISFFAGAVMVFFGLQTGGFLPDIAGRIPGFSSPAGLLRRAGSGGAPGVWCLMGLANGFLPCGLVYSALALALHSSNPVDGAFIMLLFGMGTLPALAATSLLMRKVDPARRRSLLKFTAVIVVIFGLFIILRTFAMVGEKPIMRHQMMKNYIENGAVHWAVH